jgi:hypothetical protein
MPKRSPPVPFLLVVVDHDTERFTIEGPMLDDQSWVEEILRASRAGRHITCFVLAGSNRDPGSIWRQAYGCTRWPEGSIISPAETTQLPSRQGARPAFRKLYRAK